MRVLTIDMEASCSGLHASMLSADLPTHHSERSAAFLPISLRYKYRQKEVAKARASLCKERGTGKRREFTLWRRSGQQRCSNIAFATPQVEVIAQGEVADVEEIEGIRVLMDEQNRPMVEYLIKWKVRDRYMLALFTLAPQLYAQLPDFHVLALQDGAPSTW